MCPFETKTIWNNPRHFTLLTLVQVIFYFRALFQPFAFSTILAISIFKLHFFPMLLICLSYTTSFYFTKVGISLICFIQLFEICCFFIHFSNLLPKIATQTISNTKGFHTIIFKSFLFLYTLSVTCIHVLSWLKIQSGKGAQKEITLLFCPVEKTFDAESALVHDDLGCLLNPMGLNC